MDKHQAAEAMADELRRLREVTCEEDAASIDAALSAYSQATATPAITAEHIAAAREIVAAIDEIGDVRAVHLVSADQIAKVARALLAAPPPAPVATREPVARVRASTGQPQSYGVPVFIEDGVTRTSPMVHLPRWDGVHAGQALEVEVFPATTDKGG